MEIRQTWCHPNPKKCSCRGTGRHDKQACQFHGKNAPSENASPEEIKEHVKQAYKTAYSYYQERLRQRGYTGRIKTAVVFHYGRVPENPSEWIDAIEELVNDYLSL